MKSCQRAEPCVERAVAEAVAVVQPLAGAFMPTGTDQAFHGRYSRYQRQRVFRLMGREQAEDGLSREEAASSDALAEFAQVVRVSARMDRLNRDDARAVVAGLCEDGLP